MSTIATIRDTIQLLTLGDLDQIPILLEALKVKHSTLKKDATKLSKTETANRNKRKTLIGKIQAIQPDFSDDGQPFEALDVLYQDLKSTKETLAKENKRRKRLEKKWKDSDLEGDCPDMDNDALDAHIRDLIQNRKKAKATFDKEQNNRKKANKKRDELAIKLTALDIPHDPNSTLEELQTLHTNHLDNQKALKKENDNIAKFKRQLEAIIHAHPDAGIPPPPQGASSQTLELAVQHARQTRENYKKQLAADKKAEKDQERADKKQATDLKKSQEKAQKEAAKQAGQKGTQKNAYFARFASWVTAQQLAGYINQSDIDEVGGKREYNKIEWARLDDSQKKNPNAPWNAPTV